MNVGERITQALKANEISQTALASMLGIPVSTLSGYITGRYAPDCVKLKEIACVLGVTADYLLGIDSEITLSKDEALLVEGFRKLSRTKKKVVLEHVRFLYNS